MKVELITVPPAPPPTLEKVVVHLSPEDAFNLAHTIAMAQRTRTISFAAEDLLKQLDVPAVTDRWLEKGQTMQQYTKKW